MREGRVRGAEGRKTAGGGEAGAKTSEAAGARAKKGAGPGKIDAADAEAATAATIKVAGSEKGALCRLDQLVLLMSTALDRDVLERKVAAFIHPRVKAALVRMNAMIAPPSVLTEGGVAEGAGAVRFSRRSTRLGAPDARLGFMQP